jgi:4-amino-4-deoxy-L-arabinose transferase-like glycosyltransferase
MTAKNVIANIRRVWLKSVHVLLDGDITIRRRSFSKTVLAGILGVVLLYVSVAGVVSVSAPLAIRKDAIHHIDYIWLVYNGKLPNFKDGVTYPPLASGHNFQQAASHPPLFYLIHAPFLGPLLNAGKWKEAIAVGRIINILFGVLCVLALAWAGWVFGGSKRALMAIAVPAIGALMYRFTTLNVIFGNDVLVVLIATLSFIFIYKLLKEGLQTKYLLALGLLSVLGMASKATYVVVLAINLITVIIAAIMHRKGRLGRRIAYGAVLASVIALAVAVFIGWFYYRNYQLSGSWFKSSPDDFTGGRAYMSLKDVLTGSGLWSLFYTNSSTAPYISTAVTSMAAAGFLTLKHKKIKVFYKQNRAWAITIALLVLAVAGILMTQIQLAVGNGAINFRYLLPALLPISLFLAYGLLQFRLARAQLVSIAAISIGLTTLLPVAASTTVSGFFPAVAGAKDYIGKIFIAASCNGVPRIITTLLLLSFVIGAVLLVVSLFRLSSPKRA